MGRYCEVVASRFVRKVRTSSGAVAVQVLTRRGREVLKVEHVGSAHTDAELELLLEVARKRLDPGQQAFDLGAVEQMPARVDEVADWTGRSSAALRKTTSLVTRRPRSAAGGKVVATSALLLWRLLDDAYSRLGFSRLEDEAFKALVLARIIEPTSKADSIRVLAEVGVKAPALNTIYRCLKRCQDRDYRNKLSAAAAAFSARTTGTAALVMYDVTTLHFEIGDEDQLRKVGMSKEHRVDPQVQVGLLVDQSGFPLEVQLFEGNKAETTTLVPVLEAFQRRYGLTGIVVVADAGMLSAGNLNALEDAGFSFIVGSRIAKAPYDLAEHFARHGNHFDDGQILESTRVMGTGKAARERRVLYQWSLKRQKHDEKTINAMVAKAQKITDGQAPMRKTRFLKVSGTKKQLDDPRIERARQLAGLKGYVTDLTVETMSGAAVIAAYHDLWQVEASFRMTKSDLRARPIFHHQKESIEAHLTVVFAALAITRHLTAVTGYSIKKIVQTLRTVRSATIEINGQTLTLDPDIPPTAADILTAMQKGY